MEQFANIEDKTATAHSAVQKPAEWTVALYLGVVTDVDGPNGRIGAEQKARKLEALKAETKGSPVTIVADVLDRAGVDPLKSPEAGSLVVPAKPRYEVTRLVIHDGVEEVVSHRKSKSTAGNIADLMDYARKELPAHKMAVVINAHGAGDQGVNGGGINELADGYLSPAELAVVLRKPVADGTAASQPLAPQQDKIEFLDFDGCFGAQLGQVKAVSSAANNLVASETWERSYVIGDGRVDDAQNLNSWLSALIANPQMDGRQLAKEVVAQADRKANATITDATPTLASFDLQAGLKRFDELLNNVGSALSTVEKTGKNKAVLEAIIDRQVNVTSLDKTEPMQGSLSKYDLDDFLKDVQREIRNGRLRDPGGQLRRSVVALDKELQNRNGFVSNYHFAGIHPQPFNGTPVALAPLHGLSIYLPTFDARSGHVPDRELRYVYALESDGGTTGWSSFLQSMVRVEE